MEVRQQQLNLPTIYRYWSIADELYAAGHRLHAFLVLQSLLGSPCAIPQYYRREEILCRVHAVEILMSDLTVKARHESQPSHSHVGVPSPNASSFSTIGARLELAQPILAPMFASPRYFENALLCPVLWEHSVRGEEGDSNTLQREAEEEMGEVNRMVPIALVVKAHVLHAMMHRRRLRYVQAVHDLDSARQWAVSVFTNTVPIKPYTSKVGEKTNGRAFSDPIVLERQCCEALLDVEMCRVFYSQLMSHERAVNPMQRNAAALHRARTTALERLLHHAKSYTKYVRRTPNENLPTHPSPSQHQEERISPLCLSSSENPFSLRATAQVLGFYYCTALILSHHAAEAETELQRCGELFGSLPEFASVAQLLTIWHKGPLAMVGHPSHGVKRGMEVQFVPIAGTEHGASKRPRLDDDLPNDRKSVHFGEDEDGKSDNEESDDAHDGGGESSRAVEERQRRRWISDGLLQALQTYVMLHKAVLLGETRTTTTAATEVPHEDSKDGKTLVQHLFHRTLERIDEQLTHLTTTHHTPNAKPISQTPFLRSAPSSEIRFLVLLKCAALVTMTGHALSHVQLGLAVQHLLALRRYMAVFQRHTTGVLTPRHLLTAQLALALSLRHLPGDAPNPLAPTDADAVVHPDTESAAAFDVGLPYAHLLAAERAARESAPLFDRAAPLVLALGKSLALYHTAHIGAMVHLDATAPFGFRRAALTRSQRQRCAAALTRTVSALTASAADPQTAAAWTPLSRTWLRLLRGLWALGEARDAFAALSHFRAAWQSSRTHAGERSPLAAGCARLAEDAAREQAIGSAPDTERAARVEGRSHEMAEASRLAFLHFARHASREAGAEGAQVLAEWEAEVRRVCSAMREELLEVLSL